MRIPEDREQAIIEQIARRQHSDSVVESIEPFLTMADKDTLWTVILSSTEASWHHHVVLVTREQIAQTFQEQSEP